MSSFTGRLALKCSRLGAFQLASAKFCGFSLVSGTLGLSAAAAKRAGKVLSAALDFAGNLLGRAGKALTATLSFSGALARRASRALAAALSFAGAIARRTDRSTSGTLGLTAALRRRAGKALAAALSFVGGLAQLPNKALAAALSFAGEVDQLLSKNFAATLATSGALLKRAGKALGAALGLAGLLGRAIYHGLAGAVLGLAGALLGGIPNRSLYTGRLALSCSRLAAFQLASSKACTQTFVQTMTAALGLSGAVAFLRPIVLAAALALSGAVSKGVSRALAATLTIPGIVGVDPGIAELVKRTSRALSSGLGFFADLVGSGGLSKVFEAGLNLSGAVSRGVSRALAATLTPFVVDVVKRTSRALSGTMGLAGQLAATSVIGVVLASVLSFSGGVGRSVRKALAGVLDFFGTLPTTEAVAPVVWGLVKRAAYFVTGRRGTTWRARSR